MKKQIKWSEDTDALFQAILNLKSIKECQKFFRDLLTEKEIFEFANRWKVAQMLSQRKTYKKIEKQTGMSSTTIARIHRWLNRGTGGYKLMIKRLKKYK